MVWGGVVGGFGAVIWFLLTQWVFTPLYPVIERWRISEYFMIRWKHKFDSLSEYSIAHLPCGLIDSNSINENFHILWLEVVSLQCLSTFMSVNTQYLFSISGTRALSQIFYGLSLWQLEVKLTPEKKLVQGRAAEFYTRRPKTLSLNKKYMKPICTYALM